jgi:hypothetical protein
MASTRGLVDMEYPLEWQAGYAVGTISSTYALRYQNAELWCVMAGGTYWAVCCIFQGQAYRALGPSVCRAVCSAKLTLLLPPGEYTQGRQTVA